MNAFGVTFVVALAVACALRWWLGARHLAHVAAHRTAVPPEFAGQIGLVAHQRAADYTSAKTRLGLFSVAMEALISLALTFGEIGRAHV